MELNVGETSQLQVKMDPIPTLDADKELIFTSFNPDVATVDENGVITAHKTGYAYIQITSASDCRIMTYCMVCVKPCAGEHNFENGACTDCGLAQNLLGDVNSDGKVNTTDAKLIMQLDLGLIEQFPVEE